MNVSDSSDLEGVIVAGRYRVLRRIGEGGMGVVYEVQHTRLSRRFAMKTIHQHRAQRGDGLARFRREADLVSGLRNAHIVDVVDWDALPDGTPCMIMEYLEGMSLRSYLDAHGPLPWRDLARWASQIASGLSAAHKENVVHRDLKPDNLFLVDSGDGELSIKILDFGVSKILGSKTIETTDAKLVGTPSYMAPEQADGNHQAIGPQTDCWALGSILFEMATGRCAYPGASIPAVLYQICHGPVPNLREFRPDAPAAFVALVEGLLSRDPDRIVSMATVLSRLNDGIPGTFRRPPTFGDGDETFALPPGETTARIRPRIPPPPPLPSRMWSRSRIGAVVGLLGVVVCAAWLWPSPTPAVRQPSRSAESLDNRQQIPTNTELETTTSPASLQPSAEKTPLHSVGETPAAATALESAGVRPAGVGATKTSQRPRVRRVVRRKSKASPAVPSAIEKSRTADETINPF